VLVLVSTRKPSLQSLQHVVSEFVVSELVAWHGELVKHCVTFESTKFLYAETG